jgi:hypothetical protein
VTNDDDGFASAGSPTSVTVASTMPNDDSSGSTSDGSGSTTDGSSDGTDGGDTSSSSSATLDPTLAESSSDGAVDPTDGQPADGMWSMCIDAAMDCGNIPILCITNADMTDGFCSTTGCANPAVDCLPAPGGTAMPACAPITVNDQMEQACVLNCAGGLVCPTGMVCMNFTNLGMICM